MLVETVSMSFRKARSANSTDSGFPSRVPTMTAPSGTGVINLCTSDGMLAQNGMVLLLYGLGADNDTMSCRVIGWRSVGENDVTTGLWIPVILCEFAAVLSGATGVAGATILNTERFADTITLTTGNDDVSVDIVSPTGDVIAHAMMDLKGFQKVELTFKLGGTPPTSMNALVALL